MNNSLLILVLTFNEEKNLPKFFDSIKSLNCPVYVIDSFSTDNTIAIAKKHRANVFQNKFETHTKQWKFALEQVPTDVSWVIGLDADQEISDVLAASIQNALQKNDPSISGFYFCRKNYFLDKWIRFGGYYPRYLLKMFRRENVLLDENEKMDHHFYVNGLTQKLQGDLLENNLKEDLSFWKEKHRRYAKLQAEEEFLNSYKQVGSLWGNSDQRRVALRKVWNSLPLFIRPIIYLFIRMFLQLGFLDGRKGIKFHYLQAFWYRNLVDTELYALRSASNPNYERQRFLFLFIPLSALLYYFNIFWVGLAAEGGQTYSPFVEAHLNYIQIWRSFLIWSSTQILQIWDLTILPGPDYFRIMGSIRVNIGYSCIGFGVMSVYSALLIAYPLSLRQKVKSFVIGFAVLNLINIIRIVAVALTYHYFKASPIDHHLVFNIICYALLFWYFTGVIKKSKNVHSRN
jgi:exosortase/archaeosortase family protein